MFKKGPSKLMMARSFGENAVIDETIYECELLRYEKRSECIYLLLKEGMLTEISQDALYRCRLEENDTLCEVIGCIRERYCSEEGNILEFKIENGVYLVNGEQNIK